MYINLRTDSLKEEYGDYFTYSDDLLELSHKVHDLDGNGFVTKEEVIWAIKLKTRYYAAKHNFS